MAKSSSEARLLRAVRKAEVEAYEAGLKKLRRGVIDGPIQDVGTGQTIIKLQQKPLAHLVDCGKIGGAEISAAQQIDLAVSSIKAGGRLLGISYDRVDRGHAGDAPWPARIAEAVNNYQDWANHWSRERNRTRNPMLQVIWEAVIEEYAFHVIAQNVGCSRRRAEKAVICGLRHYAAYHGFVSGALATAWFQAAEDVFNRRGDTTS
jgi:hypothetical protein